MKSIPNQIPYGTILMFAGTVLPPEFVWCDGASYSRTTRRKGFEVLGTAFGAPDVNNYNVPDFRGIFPRGQDNMGGVAGGNDPDASSRTAAKTGGNTGNALGSYQTDAIRAHGHTYRIANNTGPNNGLAANSGQVGYNSSAGTFTVDSNSGNETRPKNISVGFIIKI